MARTTSDLLTSVKRRAQLPDDSGTLSDTDILAFGTDELQNVVMPRLMAMNEWHYAFTYTETLSSSREIRISPRVAGNRIISIEYLDGSDYRYIPLRHPLLPVTQSNSGEYFSIYGNKITLSAGVSTSGTLRVRAVLRPSQLVSSGCTAVTSVSGTTINVTSSSGFSANQLVDLVYGTSPYELCQMSSISSVPGGGTSVVIAATAADTTLGATANPGRLCPAEQTDRVQLPDELHDYLAQRVAIRCMEARGFTEDMQNHLRKLADMELSFERLMSPRVKGEYKAIVTEEYGFGWRV